MTNVLKFPKMKIPEGYETVQRTKILDQDREHMYDLDLESIRADVVSEIGVNMMMKVEGREIALGTFDSLKEVVDEMMKISKNENPYYVVSGYSNGIENEWD